METTATAAATAKSKRIARPLPTLPGEPSGSRFNVVFLGTVFVNLLMARSSRDNSADAAHNGVSCRAKKPILSTFSLHVCSHHDLTDRQYEGSGALGVLTETRGGARRPN